ncbi:hypothetical protein CSC94_21820 [Zhengella mangrovi]|uniref:DUF4407 domain-containing protein n=1 Tax=Zhengella mangrovi TaxID=1982044 RepID=A0A2G1QHP2_9HYPH|nr:hypothetical protein [Zhengella mangrovi]PHP64974.1 hypothetical protein CSC94_21820 [Zhengella mangrovi]
MAYTPPVDDAAETHAAPGGLPEKPKRSVEQVAITLLSLLGAGAFALALPSLISDRGPGGYGKIIVIALGAGLVSFTINYLALETGTIQASRGYLTSRLFSLVSILFVGSSLACATYAGFSIRDVEALSLAQHAQVVGSVVADRNRRAVEANQTDAGLQTIESGLSQHLNGELTNATISGKTPGPGPITRLLEEKLAQARDIRAAKQQGEARRVAAVATINRLMTRYRNLLADRTIDIHERRRDLQGIHMEIAQQIAILDEAQPVALMKAYADELKRGVDIPGRPEVTARLNAILAGYGVSLSNLLDHDAEAPAPMPRYPSEVGVVETLNYVGHFWPLAAVVICIELLVPVSVWLYASNGHHWGRFTREHQQQAAADGPATQMPAVTPADTAPARPTAWRSHDLADDALIGAHPHPHATRARQANGRAGKTGASSDREGHDDR